MMRTWLSVGAVLCLGGFHVLACSSEATDAKTNGVTPSSAGTGGSGGQGTAGSSAITTEGISPTNPDAETKTFNQAGHAGSAGSSAIVTANGAGAGGSPPVANVIITPVVNTDPDGDGVIGDADACPNEPGNVGGCPDTDGDGVLDKNDHCPALAAPAGITNGCPGADGNNCGVSVAYVEKFCGPAYFNVPCMAGSSSQQIHANSINECITGCQTWQNSLAAANIITGGRCVFIDGNQTLHTLFDFHL